MSKTLLIILGNQLFNPIYLKKIKFDLIFDTIKHVMEKFDKNSPKIQPTLEQILTADEKARLFSLDYIKKTQ